MNTQILAFYMRPTPKSKRGMWDGWTLPQLRKELTKVKGQMAKAKTKVPQALRSRFAQLTFAIRAKQKGKGHWGKVQAKVLPMDNPTIYRTMRGWVKAYNKARKSKYPDAAARMRKSIDKLIELHDLDANQVWRNDPDATKLVRRAGGTVRARLQQLTVQADDIAQSMVIVNKLRKLGCKTFILEPRNNPEFADKDIAALTKSGEIYEIIEANKSALGIKLKLFQDGKFYATLGAYTHYKLNRDNARHMLVELTSPPMPPHRLTLARLLEILNDLLLLTDNAKLLARGLKNANTQLHWIRSTVSQHTVTSTATLAYIDDRHHGHVTPIINSTTGSQLKARCGGAPSCPVCQTEWREKYHAEYPNKTSTAADSKQIAETILAQLGGSKFSAMTGAKNFVRDKAGLWFDLPRGAKDGINKIHIQLNADDTYTMSGHKFRRLQLIDGPKREHISVDQLHSAFTQMTGLDTRL